MPEAHRRPSPKPTVIDRLGRFQESLVLENHHVASVRARSRRAVASCCLPIRARQMPLLRRPRPARGLAGVACGAALPSRAKKPWLEAERFVLVSAFGPGAPPILGRSADADETCATDMHVQEAVNAIEAASRNRKSAPPKFPAPRPERPPLRRGSRGAPRPRSHTASQRRLSR